MFEFSWVNDTTALAVAALALLTTIILCMVGFYLVRLGKQVVTLLGNHLRHDLGEQKRVLERIEDVLKRIEEKL